MRTKCTMALVGGLICSTIWAGANAAPSAQTTQPLYVAAASTGAGSSQAAVASALPPAQTVNGVTYISGGFGLEESTAMMAAIPQFSVAMIFAEANGAYLAYIPLRITGPQGFNLELTSTGPILLMDLPDGQYTVTASYQGRDKTARFTVRGNNKGQRLVFAW